MVFRFGANPTTSFLPPQIQWNCFIPPTLTPPKWRHQTPTVSASLTTPSNSTISTSSTTPSNNVVLTNDYLLVVVVLINRRESLASSHCSLSRRSSLFFQWNPLFPSFSPHQERSMISSPWYACRWSTCKLRCVVENKAEWAPAMDLQWRSMEGVERKREFEINLGWELGFFFFF